MMYRNSAGEIIGLWFHDAVERNRMYSELLLYARPCLVSCLAALAARALPSSSLPLLLTSPPLRFARPPCIRSCLSPPVGAVLTCAKCCEFASTPCSRRSPRSWKTTSAAAATPRLAQSHGVGSWLRRIAAAAQRRPHVTRATTNATEQWLGYACSAAPITASCGGGDQGAGPRGADYARQRTSRLRSVVGVRVAIASRRGEEEANGSMSQTKLR